MNNKEKILHYVGAKYIIGENISIKINGEEAQLTTFKKLLDVSKSLKECLDSNSDIEVISKLIYEKKELTKEFQKLTCIKWRL